MKLFIDTGNLKEIEKLVPLGIIDGITTNPSLLSKEPGDYRENLKKICQMVQGPTSAEVVETDADKMIQQGRDLAKIDPWIVVKVPLTRDGIKACKALSGEGIKVNVTLCFSPAQALLAAKVGATYISPFVGRLDDVGTPGMELIRDIVEIYEHYSFKTEILVASTRSPTSSPSERSDSSTRPSRTSTPCETPRTATASAASAPVRLAASTRRCASMLSAD